jgi:hypothetical protein
VDGVVPLRYRYSVISYSFPQASMSLNPGAAVATCSSVPPRSTRRVTRSMPTNSRRYSIMASRGVIDTTSNPNGVGVSVKPGSGTLSVRVTSRRPSTSASSTRRPPAAAAEATAAATVDLPVPPLPETTRIRRPNSSSHPTAADYRDRRTWPRPYNRGS